MKKQIYLKSLILYLVSFFCSFTQLPAQQPDVLIHYLGHSSFIIQFDNGVKILTDYGTSNSYGLPSPIYDMGHLQPDVVTYSHKHRDHYGREIRVNIPYILQNLDSLNIEGIRIYPIRTCEDNLATESNTSFIFEYKGLTICHLGDAQANIMNINNQTNRDHLKEIFPENIDLLFMTIGFTSNIILFDEIEYSVIISIKNLTKTFIDGEVETKALRGVSMDIKKGELLSEHNLTAKRPGNGISPLKWNEVVGKKAARYFEKDNLIELNQLVEV